MDEPLVKPLHLAFPLALGHQWPRAHDEDGFDVAPGLQLSEDQARLDGLADAHAIGDQQPRAVRSDEAQHRAELIGDEIDAGRVERIQRG